MSWTHYLIKTLNEPQFGPDDGIPNWIKTGDENTYLHAEQDGGAVPSVMARPELAGASVIGAWGEDGSRLAADTAAYQEVRPLGNEPPQPIYDDEGNPVGQTRGGNATGHLGYHHWAGMPVRVLGATGGLYPDDNDPFEIEIRHYWFDGTWAGWGWRAEVVGDAASRDPSVRAIGVYSDPDCTQYLYTTGAFQRGPSAWQTDADGNPLDVWFSETPAGRANPDKEDWHLAVLWASVQEGYETLEADAEAIHHNYWAETQGGTVVLSQWFEDEDSGIRFQVAPYQRRLYLDWDEDPDPDVVRDVAQVRQAVFLPETLKVAIIEVAERAGLI